MKKVCDCDNQIEAHMLKDALRRESIPVEIRGESLAGALGELPKFMISPTLWVPDELYERAKAVLKAIEEDQREQSFADWVCVKCQEENEGQFSECWNCRTKAPAES